MFKQITLNNNLFTFFRKNQTYRLLITSKDDGNDVFGVEMPVNVAIKLIKELRRLARKDLNLRPIEWEINNYTYSCNPVWPSAKSEQVWLSFVSNDSTATEKDCIVTITFEQLNQLIAFLEDVNEL